jgi:hypothetical protein
MRTRKPTKCPRCGNKTVLPIAYGMPGPDLWEESQKGRVLLGGCVIMPNQPRKACTTCDWDDAGPRPDDGEDIWDID